MIPAPVIPPRENPLLLGHAGAEARLLEALGGRMAHAWLVTGPEGVGKATLAFRLARRLLAGAPHDIPAGPAPDAPADTLALDPLHPVFRRVAAGTHADLLTIERVWDDKKRRLKKQIAAEDVRLIPGFLHLTPAEAGWRVVIVDGAEDMSPASANALLKILEEPPPRAVLVLVCASPGRLLPTLRSRCRQLRLGPLEAPDMEALLARLLPGSDAPERAELQRLAEGSPGRALALAAEDGIAIAALVAEVLGALPRPRPSLAYAVADRLGRGEGAFDTFMDLLRAALAGALRASLRGSADASQQRLVSALGGALAGLSDLWDALTRLQLETDSYNLDKRQALVSALSLLGGSR